MKSLARSGRVLKEWKAVIFYSYLVCVLQDCHGSVPEARQCLEQVPGSVLLVE